MNFIKNANFICAKSLPLGMAPYFKKDFSINGKIKKAELQISALGVYVAELNGKRIGDFIMAPGWTQYEKRVLFQVYDVFDMLKAENSLIVGVGSGWYGSSVGFTAKYPLGEHPALIAALKITYEDGKEELIVTDRSWFVSKSETLSSTIYDGEITDRRILPEYNEKADLLDYDKELLVLQDGEDVIETERLPVKEIIKTPKGECVLDFGQNMTGYVEFKVTGKAGDTVRITCAEILDKDGNFYNENYRTAKSEIVYTLGGGTEVYKPKYTFFGFRYLKLENWCEEISAENFTAIVVHSNIRRTGYFECSNKKVNKLFENVIWGQRGNFLDIPTDCPQRNERLGWTGDAQVFCRTAFLNYDCEKFFKKWLRDLALAQQPDGGVPRVVPNANHENPNDSAKDGTRRHSSAWGDAATICPYELYMAYGDKEFLKEIFPVMKKWVDFIDGCATDYIWDNGFHFGDWLSMDKPDDYKGGTDFYLIATAFFYHSCKLVIKAGHILCEDVSHYEYILPLIKKAFNKKFIKDGKLISDTQTAAVLALHFDLISDDMDKKAISNRLIELIEERGDTLTTGFVGTPYLLDTLTEIGRADKAYTLLLQEKFPSWLFSVNMGATTIWEHWNGISEDGSLWSANMNSFNHYAYGAVASYMYRTVCGIRYDENEPAYKHFYIAPIPDGRLEYAKASLDTRYGKITSEWKYQDGKPHYFFTIPKGTVATVIIDGGLEELSEGSYER